MITLLTRVLVACICLAVWEHTAAQTPGQVELIFLDVGQGDAIIVRSPEGAVALVDAGPDGSVLELIRGHGIIGIGLAIASHAHADHIGGMERIIRSMPVGYYSDNGIPHTTDLYNSLMQTLQAFAITYLEVRKRDISLGSVELTLLPPPGEGDQNNNSVGVLIEYGDFTALLSGDSGVEELQHFLSLGIPRLTVLKAPHHGSRDGLTPEWLAATLPKVVVVSCGRDNQYGHPDPWALRYYRTVAEEVYRTDLDGEVTVWGARDGTYSVRTARGSEPGGRLELTTITDYSWRVITTYAY